jgi:K+-transporting ATPase KdpF subunit
MDLFYISLLLALFASSLGFVQLCERVEFGAAPPTAARRETFMSTLYVICGIIALLLLIYLVIALLKPEAFS